MTKQKIWEFLIDVLEVWLKDNRIRLSEDQWNDLADRLKGAQGAIDEEATCK